MRDHQWRAQKKYVCTMTPVTTYYYYYYHDNSPWRVVRSSGVGGGGWALVVDATPLQLQLCPQTVRDAHRTRTGPAATPKAPHRTIAARAAVVMWPRDAMRKRRRRRRTTTTTTRRRTRRHSARARRSTVRLLLLLLPPQAARASPLQQPPSQARVRERFRRK